MNWFLVALSAPVLWAVSSHTDKYLLSKYVRGSGIGSLIIFSCLFSIIVLPIIAFLRPQIIDVTPIHIVILVSVGLLNTFGVLFYLYALGGEEASVVAPLFQLAPVFGFIFGYIILNETLTATYAIGSGLTIIGSMLLCIELKSKNFHIKAQLLFFMLASAISFGLHGVLFKLIAIQETFLLSAFWEYAGLLLGGVLFFVFIKQYRNQFLDLISHNRLPVTLMIFGNETLVLLGNLATAYAFTLAPITVVLAVGGFQPFFVLIFGIILTIFFPKITRENIQINFLLYKLTAVAVIFVGGYLLNT